MLRLQDFWTARECLLLPACDFTVPFATLHPDAFFGVLEPDPWRAVFLQPVRRPLDGRYGEHPFRLAKHLQLLVVLQPPPADVQGLYLESLEALGLELELHDVRFSDWSWAQRSLDARGRGWHALVDGLGVTRLTFLERLAGRDLESPCVEICYGLERLAMTLQGAASAFELGWTREDADYRRLRLRDEEELSRYAFEVADPGELLRRFEVLEQEAERCLAGGLARAAYELSVRCLEPIDLLDARGVLSARERAESLDRVRDRVIAAAGIARDPPDSKPPPAKRRRSAKATSRPGRRARRPSRKRGRAKRDAGSTPDGGGADR